MSPKKKCIRKHARRLTISTIDDQAELIAQQIGQNFQARHIAFHERSVLVVVVLIAIWIGIKMNLQSKFSVERMRNGNWLRNEKEKSLKKPTTKTHL